MVASEILLQVNMDCTKTASLAVEKLQAASFQVVQTFDLQTARSTHSNCSCPHHGTDLCDCQMLIFLVYGNDVNPITLLFHGRDQHTKIYWAIQPGQRVKPELELKIWNTIAGDDLRLLL